MSFLHRTRSLPTLVRTAVCALPLIVALPASAQVLVEIGLPDLIARLGAANTPTGFGIGGGQIEAPAGTGYGPSQADSQFIGVMFTPMSGPPGFSGHATTVGHNFYGSVSSPAKDMDDIWLWAAADFLQGGYLNAQGPSTLQPASPPGNLRVFNHSWIGSTGSAASDNSCLRRGDFVINRDQTLFFSGMNNAGGSYQPLMVGGYNGLAVGRSDGQHVSGPTPGGIDGPGRMKPEIVAPGTATSWSTPVVAAVAAVLLETAATDPAISLNPNADHSLVIKSVLLAGAKHRPAWTNNPVTSGPNRGVTATPLDSKYGVDVVNVDRSHLILTAGEFDGGGVPALATPIGEVGWDLVSVPASQSRWWTFTTFGTTESLSVAATWHRLVASNFSSSTNANFDLRLWRVDGMGDLQTLVGDPGIPFFDGGNVVSQSAIDNVEHLYVTGLAAGTYVLELARIDGNIVPFSVGISWIRSPDPGSPGVPGDLNGDGVVDGADLGILLSLFGTAGPLGDLNGDGVVDGADLGALLGLWG
ncbi:MAG TPA: hypothetical protein PKC43_04715 [Phycisphaerales bacterium]|nr:hypothetical protein [Phycisphaerales bacterium]HMP36730.1 hypothetical protein [Phycisphaerales bacterium]